MVMGLLLAVPLGMHFFESSYCTALVTEQISLYAGPDVQYHVVAQADPYAQLKVHELRASWCKVGYSNTIGWVPLEKIVIV